MSVGGAGYAMFFFFSLYWHGDLWVLCMGTISGRGKGKERMETIVRIRERAKGEGENKNKTKQKERGVIHVTKQSLAG